MMTQTMLRQISNDIPPRVSNTSKVEMIVPHISAILRIVGLDLEEEGLRETPRRVATMLVKETFSGLDPERKPQMTLFRNTTGYDGMVLAKDITFFTSCEHHLVPFFGSAHVAYFPKMHVVGLSKLNRLVQYLASKPQTQERLTMEIRLELEKALQTSGVAVVIEATHLCIAARGIRDARSITRTSSFSGMFEKKENKDELFRQIELNNGRREETHV